MSEKNPGLEARVKVVEAIITFQEQTCDDALKSAAQYQETGATEAQVVHMVKVTGARWKDFVCSLLGVSKEEYDETMRRGGWV